MDLCNWGAAGQAGAGADWGCSDTPDRTWRFSLNRTGAKPLLAKDMGPDVQEALRLDLPQTPALF